MNSNKYKNKVFWALTISTLLLFGRAPISHSADATLFFSPSSKNLDVGQTFSVNVNVSSLSQAMNAASGTISFDQTLLSVSSVSKSGTIINLWTREPSFSNSSGSVTFEGIVLNPGYQGSNGNLVTISFKAKAAGTASVRLVGGSVLANDGLGTNLVSGFGSASFSIGSSSAPTPTPPPAQSSEQQQGGVPAAPKISSATHPDQNAWYKDANPKFSWSNPSGTTGVNVLADHNPDTDPGTKSDGLFNEYIYKDVDNGTWYFHAKLKNSNGWGQTAHYKFQIDTTIPQITSAEVVNADTNKTSVVVKASGLAQIDRFEVASADQQNEQWKLTQEGNGEGIFEANGLPAGTHKIAVKAFDKAGNVIEKTLEFKVADASGIPGQEQSGIRKISFYLIWTLGILLIIFFLLLIGTKIGSRMIHRRRKHRQFRNELKRTMELLDVAKRKRKLSTEEQEILYNLKKIYIAEMDKRSEQEGIQTVEGIFDGEGMISYDSRKYTVPQNYAAKSKLLEGDKLLLTITADGSFIYKQIGPQTRQHNLAILEVDDNGNYRAITGNRSYRVLRSAVVLSEASSGDEVEIIVPKGEETVWAALESVRRHAEDIPKKVSRQKKARA